MNADQQFMERREFITLVGAAAVMWPVAVRGQDRAKLRRLGLLLPNTPAVVERNPRIQAFLDELRALKWIDGQTLQIEWRFGEGQLDRLGALAVDLARANVEVIVTASAPAAKAAKDATNSIPIVIIDPGDPVRTGLVQSLAHPGGNITGVTSIAPDLAAKRLALLKEAAPVMADVAILFNADIPPEEIAMAELEGASRSLNLRVSQIAVHGRKGLMDALARLAQQHPDGLLVFADPLTFANQDAIVNLAMNAKLPALYGAKEFVGKGGLMSYGPSYSAMFRRAAHFVDRILKGSKPADLPVEQPVRFELAINLKTAKALGLTVPATLLAHADEVIE